MKLSERVRGRKKIEIILLRVIENERKRERVEEKVRDWREGENGPQIIVRLLESSIYSTYMMFQ